MRRPSGLIRRGVLAIAVLSVVAYLGLHSPLRSLLAKVVEVRSDTCYFACLEQLGAQQLAEAASGVLLLVAAAFAARGSTQQLRGLRADRILGFGVAWIAFASVPAAFVAGLGQLIGEPILRPPLGPLLASVPSAAAIFAVTTSNRRWRRPALPAIRPTALMIWMATVAAALLIASLTVRVTHPPSSYDALSYHAPLSVFLWRGGDIASFLLLDSGYWSLAHPGVAEIWAGLLDIIGADNVADLSQVPFAFLGAVAVSTIARRTGLPTRAAALAAAAYLLVPLLAAQLGTRLNDVVGAGIFLAAAGLLSAPARHWTLGRVALVAVALGLVATTKLALLPATAALGVILVLGVGRPTGSPWLRSRREKLHNAVVAAAAFAIVILPWWARNVALYGNPLYPVDLPVLGGGFDQTLLAVKDADFVPSPLAWLVYPLLEGHSEFSGMGPLFLLALSGFVCFAFLARHRSRLVMPALVWALTIPTWWVLTRHEPRFLLGPAGMLFAFLPWTLVVVGRTMRPVAYAGLAAAAAASVLITLVSAVAPLADDPTDPVAFYDDVWAVLPDAMTLPASEGLLWEYGCASMTYPALYPLLQPPPHDPIVRRVVPISCLESATRIEDRMRAMGVRYAYVMVSSDQRADVESKHPAGRFRAIASDTISGGRLSGTSRYLYQLAAGP